MIFKITNNPFVNVYESVRKQSANSVDLNVNQNANQEKKYKNNVNVSNLFKSYTLSLPLSFKGAIATPKVKYIYEGLTDFDKIAERLLKIEVEDKKRFVNNAKFKNIISILRKNPETIQYLDDLLTTRNGELPAYEIGMFLISFSKVKAYDKFFKLLLESKISCSDVRYILSHMNQENEPYLNKVLDIKNREMSSIGYIFAKLNSKNEKYLDLLVNARNGNISEYRICDVLGILKEENEKYIGKLLNAGEDKLRDDDIFYILKSVNEFNGKYLDMLLSQEYEHVKGQEIYGILSAINPNNEKHLDKLLTRRKGKSLYIDDILRVINPDNEKYLDMLLSIKEDKNLYIPNVLKVLNDGNLKHLDGLLANEALSSYDIAIILKELNDGSSKNDIDELIQKQVSKQAHCRNYSQETKTLMNEMRNIAISLNLPDFYSGKKFNIKNYCYATIEHLVPHSQKARAAVEGFNVNTLANFVPVSEDLNSKRQHLPLREWYEMNPKYLENSKMALIEYEKVNTPLINGKEWVSQLKSTLNKELGAMVFI